MIKEALTKVVARQDLTEAESMAVMQEIMTGEATPAQIAAYLTALRMKGETVDELTGMVRVMREKAVPLDVDGQLLDVVSSGGGSVDPFNISTAAAIVCAGAGVRVVKHGNRGFTSASGAANFLEAIGAKIDLQPEQIKACVEKTGFGFLMAPTFHPAMRHAGPVRAELGFRTIFNSLGPLTNPARAQHLLVGANSGGFAERAAQVLARLGTQHAIVAHGEDGLDEVTLGAPTRLWEVRGSEVKATMLMPEGAGLARVLLSEVKTGTPAENAARLHALLDGAKSADREYVLINAGVALVAADKAKTASDGVQLAAQSIDSGAAKRVLEGYVATSNSFGGTA